MSSGSGGMDEKWALLPVFGVFLGLVGVSILVRTIRRCLTEHPTASDVDRAQDARSATARALLLQTAVVGNVLVTTSTVAASSDPVVGTPVAVHPSAHISSGQETPLYTRSAYYSAV